MAGFAKGGAIVKLNAESPDITVLFYEVDAQIGGRLIDSTARKLAGEFFGSFGEVVGNATAAST